MSLHASHIPELDALIARGSPERRVKTLERMTAFFLDGASRFNDDHVRLFDFVFSRLIGEIETKARTELSRRLAPLGNAPVEAVRRLAQDDDIAVAGPAAQAGGAGYPTPISSTSRRARAKRICSLSPLGPGSRSR